MVKIVFSLFTVVGTMKFSCRLLKKQIISKIINVWKHHNVRFKSVKSSLVDGQNVLVEYAIIQTTGYKLQTLKK